MEDWTCTWGARFTYDEFEISKCDLSPMWSGLRTRKRPVDDLRAIVSHEHGGLDDDGDCPARSFTTAVSPDL